MCVTSMLCLHTYAAHMSTYRTNTGNVQNFWISRCQDCERCTRRDNTRTVQEQRCICCLKSTTAFSESNHVMCSAAPLNRYASNVLCLQCFGSRMLPKASRLLSAGGRAAFFPLGWGAASSCSLRCLLGKHAQSFQNLQDRRNVCELHRHNFVYHVDVPAVVFGCLPDA